MRRLLSTGAACLALAACAHPAGPDGSAVCDGTHRRPANPAGSVLAAAAPSAASPPATASGGAAPPADRSASYRPCGGPP